MIMPRIPAPPNDGGAIYVYYITKHMALRGHEVVMASFESNRHPQKSEMLRPYCRLYSLPAHFKPYNIPAVIKSTLTRQPISVQHRMDMDLMDKIISLIPDDSFDIISFEGIHTSRFIDLIKTRYPGIPAILRQANVEHLLLKRNAEKTKNPVIRGFLKDQARLMKKFEVNAMKSVEGVTAITPVDREKFLEVTPGIQCEVIEVGANLPRLRDYQRASNILLAISNWAWRPNKDGLKWFLEKIWPRLKEQFPEVQFLIAGHGISERLQQKLKVAGITYLGFVDDIEYYRQKATIMMVPLLSGSGLKLKILEGLASGIPIITTSIGAEGIKIQNEQDYLLAETPEDFVNQTGRLLKNPELREKLSKNARSLIEQKYQWVQKAERLEFFMNQIIKNYEP